MIEQLNKNLSLSVPTNYDVYCSFDLNDFATWDYFISHSSN